VWRFLAWWVHAAVASGCQTRCPVAFHGVLAAVILTLRYEGLGLGRFDATTWMVGDLVTTEAPPLAGLAARRRLLARLRSTGTLAYKLATTTDHKVIGIMYLGASSMRGMTAVDASSCGRLAQVPDGSHSSVRRLHRMNRWGTCSWRCYQPTKRSCSQVPGDD
jgi:hypothetical protein